MKQEDTQELFTRPEPWAKWETKLVLYSILAGIAGLIVLGILINVYILK